MIAGDTEVVMDGEVLGQPAGEDEARAHLERLSGREHEVLGGSPSWARARPSRREEGIAASTVPFRELEPALIEAYLASGEWRERAGSYAIQGLGSALMESVRGDVSNVIGLPVELLLRLAPELFTEPFPLRTSPHFGDLGPPVGCGKPPMADPPQMSLLRSISRGA